MCTARDGAVHAGGRSILYGDIVARGDLRRTFTPEQLEKIPIKAPDKRRLIGRDTLALDVPSKVNGKGIYGLDAVVEGMVYARPKIPPTRYDSKVVSIDDSAAKRRARLSEEPRSGGPVGHRAGLGDGVRGELHRRKQRGRSGEGDVELGQGGDGIRSGISRIAQPS